MGGKRGLRTKIRFSSDTVFTTVFTFVPSLRQPVPLQEVGEHSGDFLCITWTSQGHGEVRRSVRGARVDRPRRRRRSAAHSPSERRAPIRKMRGERTSSKEEEASSPKKELLQGLYDWEDPHTRNQTPPWTRIKAPDFRTRPRSVAPPLFDLGPPERQSRPVVQSHVVHVENDPNQTVTGISAQNTNHRGLSPRWPSSQQVFQPPRSRRQGAM